MRWILLKGVVICVYCIICHQLVCGADKTYLRNTITNYFSNIRHELVNSTEKQRVRDFIKEQFESFGLETYVHELNATEVQEGTFYGIIGILRGTRFGWYTDRLTFIVAHYDTVETSPGVDDNGSGVAAMLETARTITNQNKVRENSIFFLAPDLMAYAGYGMSRLAKEWLLPFAIKHFNYLPDGMNGFIVLDSILQYNKSQHSQLTEYLTMFPAANANIAADNYTGDFLLVLYASQFMYSNNMAHVYHREWLKQGRGEMGIEIADLSLLTRTTREGLAEYLQSDRHYWITNLPSMHLTDTANLRGTMQECYHQLCDNVDVMLTDENLDFLDKVTDTLIATVDFLSRSPNHSPSALLMIVVVLGLLPVIR